MAIAPLVAGWERQKGRWASLPAMPSNGAGAVGGVPFCPDEFGPGSYLRVKAGFGAIISNPSSSWAFTDITSDVLQADGNYIDIRSIGRPNESLQTPSAMVAFKLNNRANLYSKNNPLSPNWPNVKNNVPIVIEVTLDGGVNWGTLFWGEATKFQPGADATGNYAVVNVEAYGRIQRLDAHSQPLHSALYRSIVRATVQPIAYWSFEDGSSTVTAISPIAGVTAMIQSVDFSPLGMPNFASISSVPGSAPLPDWSTGGDMWGPVTGSTSGATGWTVDCVIFSGTTTSTDPITFLTIGTGTTGVVGQTEGMFLSLNQGFSPPRWELSYQYVDSGGTYHSTPTVTPSFVSTINPFDGKAHMVRVTAQQSGADIALTLIVDGRSIGSGTVSTRTLRAVTTVEIGNGGFSYTPQLAVGHAMVWTGIGNVDYTDAMNGHPGETPDARMVRLCAEEGVEFATMGFYATDTTMGAQGVDSLMNLCRECEVTDAGFLYDGLSAGLQYQGISQRYDQAVGFTLDVAQNEIRPEFIPVDDDQRITNRVTVSRKNGSSVTVEVTDGPLGTGPDGIGVVDAQLTVNPVDDSRLTYRANWEAVTGSIEGFRYPLIPLNFRAHPNLASAWLNRTDGWPGPVVPGCRVDILNISQWMTQHPTGTVSQVIEGWAMRLTNLMWEVDLVCSSNRKYEVFKIGDSQLGRVQTAGSTLAADAPAGSSSISVATQAGSVAWTTTDVHAGDFPFYMEIDGIPVLVHASGAVLNSNIDFESGISGWAGQSGWTLAASSFAYKGSGSMQITPPSGTSSGGAVAARAAATAGVTYYLSGWIYSPAGWSDMQMAVDWYTAVSGGSFISSSLPGSVSIPAGVWTNFSATVTAPATTNGGALRFRQGSTPSTSDVFYVDEAVFTTAAGTPQTFTVDPTTVTKPLLTGASVTGWHFGKIKF